MPPSLAKTELPSCATKEGDEELSETERATDVGMEAAPGGRWDLDVSSGEEGVDPSHGEEGGEFGEGVGEGSQIVAHGAPASAAPACTTLAIRGRAAAATAATARPTTGSAIQCAICSASSATTQWFLEKVIMVQGTRTVLPQELLCMLCGVSLEAWPLDSSSAEGRMSLINRYNKEVGFRKQVDAVRSWLVRLGCVARGSLDGGIFRSFSAPGHARARPGSNKQTVAST